MSRTAQARRAAAPPNNPSRTCLNAMTQGRASSSRSSRARPCVVVAAAATTAPAPPTQPATTAAPTAVALERAAVALRQQIVVAAAVTTTSNPATPTPWRSSPAPTGPSAAPPGLVTLPALLTAPPPGFAEHPEAVIGKVGCGTVYAWSPPSSPLRTAPHLAPPPPPPAAPWDWAGGVPGEFAVKCDPVTYRWAGADLFGPSAPDSGTTSDNGFSRTLTTEGSGGGAAVDLDRLGDLLPALLPPHPNVLVPEAWWAEPFPGGGDAAAGNGAPPAPGPQADDEEGAGGFKLFTLYRRFECSLWELVDRFRAAGAEAAGGGGRPPRMGAACALRVVRDVAAALEHLHTHRVLHADVKPENLLLVLRRPEEGGASRPPEVERVVLIDFGLARMLPAGVQHMESK